MPELKVLYFNIKGRAEAIRLALEVGGVPFEDERFEFKEFPALRESGRLPFQQAPTLTVDGTVYTQSEAMLRYAGKLSGLYPRDDDVLGLYIDEVLGAVAEIGMKLFKYRGHDKDKVKETREEFLNVDMPRFVGGLENIVKAKATHETWLCGDSISIADLALYYFVGNVMHGNVDHVPGEKLEAYPRLIASYKAVLDHPKVKAWNEKHPW